MRLSVFQPGDMTRYLFGIDQIDDDLSLYELGRLGQRVFVVAFGPGENRISTGIIAASPLVSKESTVNNLDNCKYALPGFRQVCVAMRPSSSELYLEAATVAVVSVLTQPYVDPSCHSNEHVRSVVAKWDEADLNRPEGRKPWKEQLVYGMLEASRR